MFAAGELLKSTHRPAVMMSAGPMSWVWYGRQTARCEVNAPGMHSSRLSVGYRGASLSVSRALGLCAEMGSRSVGSRSVVCVLCVIVIC